MSAPLVQLVHRIAAPPVAAALTKEELCLALAAVAQLRLSASASTAAASWPASTDALARRSLRLLPRCTPQEVKMIAQGANALRWSAAPPMLVTDALARRLHAHATAAARVRLSDILAVVQQAVEAQRYFDSTLHALATEHLVRVGGEAAALSEAAAEELVAVVCAYVGEEEGLAAVQRLAERLHGRTPAAGVAALRRCVPGRPLPLSTAWAATYARWAQQRRAVLDGLHDAAREDDAEQGARVPLAVQRAWHGVWTVVRTLQREGAASVSDADLQRALELVQVFHMQDPVTLTALDSAVAHHLGDAGPQSAAQRAGFEKHVYARAHVYPTALAALRQHECRQAASSPLEALQPVSAIERTYRDVVAGVAVSEKDLFQLSTSVNAKSMDEVAKTAYVFARVKEVPSSLVMLLAGSGLASLTLDGVVALIQAERHDRRGALRTVLAKCLGDTAHLQACVLAAPVASLVELANVLNLRLTRWTAPDTQAQSAEPGLMDMVVAQLLPQLEQLPLPSLLSIVSINRSRRLAGVEELTQSACEHVASQLLAAPAPLPMSLCWDVLTALERGDVVHEKLLDCIASAVAAFFAPLRNAGADADADMLAALLRFALLQLRLNAPETGVVGSSLLLHVRRVDWATVPPAVLVAAALSALDASVVTVSSWVLEVPRAVITHLVAGRRLDEGMTVELARALVELTVRTADTEAEETRAVVASVRPVVALMHPHDLARLVSLQPRCEADTTDIPAEVFETVGRHALGLPPDVFTALCAAAGSRGFDVGLANQLVDVLLHVVDDLQPPQLCQCIFGLGEMADAGQRLSHQVMTEALSDYAVDNVELFFDGGEVASMLHGFAKLLCTKRNLYSVFTARMKRRGMMATLDYRSISMLIFALGAVRFVDKALLDLFSRTFVIHADQLAAPDLLMALCGFSRMRLLNQNFYYKLGCRALQRIDEFPLHAQCQLLHAYGSLEEPHEDLAAALLARIAGSVEKLGSASVATAVLTSLWLMSVSMVGEEHVSTIVQYVVRHADELTGPDLVKLCSITVDQSWDEPELVAAIAARALALHEKERLEPTSARVVLDTLGAQLNFHPVARQQLSSLARTVSKEVVVLSGEEQEQLNLLTSH